MILIILFVICLFIICLFALPQLSPIPYFPSNKKDFPLIIQALRLKNNQVIFDLGAGDGGVLFEAAKVSRQKKLDTQFFAVEINPVLILILYLRRLFHRNKRNIKIVWGDLFKVTFRHPERSEGSSVSVSLDSSPRRLGAQNDKITFYLYVSPWLLEKIVSRLKSQFKYFNIVSYMYPIKSLKKNEKIMRGKNTLYLYNF